VRPGVLSASPLTYFMRQDDSDFVVFCFSKPEDAEVFVPDTFETAGPSAISDRFDDSVIERAKDRLAKMRGEF
jgi:hypothetical protein